LIGRKNNGLNNQNRFSDARFIRDPPNGGYMKHQKKRPLVKIDARVSKEDIQILKKNRMNISSIVREAISKAAKALRQAEVKDDA